MRFKPWWGLHQVQTGGLYYTEPGVWSPEERGSESNIVETEKKGQSLGASSSVYVSFQAHPRVTRHDHIYSLLPYCCDAETEGKMIKYWISTEW